jgi:AmpE protein
MTLITVLISLFLERFLGTVDEVRRFDWFERYAGWFSGVLRGRAVGALGVALLLAPALVGVWLLVELVDDVMLGLLEILLGVAVLVFALGPRSLDKDVESLVEAQLVDDEERLWQNAAHITGDTLPEDPAERSRCVVESVFVEGHRRLFAVLFWFMLLGPLGAALYRLSAVLAGPQETYGAVRESARRWVALLDWAPARLTALGYALMGRFDDGLAVLRRLGPRGLPEVEAGNLELLRETGLESTGASERLAELGEGEEAGAGVSVLLESALALVTRTLVVWVVVLALMTIAGWAG